MSLRFSGDCPYCRRHEIDVVALTAFVDVDDAPSVAVSTPRICDDCSTILQFSIRIGALALRHELNRMRQLDLFEAPKDRVIRLLTRVGKDAPST